MTTTIWGAWSEDWALRSKVEFDGASKVIYVHPEVTELDIRADVYSSWINWVVLRDNAKFLPAIRYTGFDPIGGGKFTGDIYFLTNGWKLSVNLAAVRVTGVLFSDDYDTAYYTSEIVPQYPASVSALVSAVVVPAAVTSSELWEYPSRSLSVPPPTAEQVAEATWSHVFANKLLTVAKYLGLK